MSLKNDFYEEKPVGQIISRRDFLKAAGVTVSTVAISGYVLTDIVQKRKSYITLRQQGLYKDDKRLQSVNLASSHKNKSCYKVYKDLDTKPMGEVAEKLLHTKTYVDRSNLLMEGAKHHG